MSQTKDIEINKAHLRQIVKERLQKHSNTERLEKSQRLQSLIAQFIEKQNGMFQRSWGGFMAMKDEVQIQWSEMDPFKFVFPKIRAMQKMVFAEVGSKLKAGPLGIFEPTGAEITPDEIQGYFVPGLAFTPRGERLGRGKGFYDRYLVNAAGIKVGIGFEDQIFEFIPVDDHDVRMDYVITEQQVIKVGDRKWKL